MKALNRKLVRDLWKIKGQVVAISLVIAAAVCVYVMYLGRVVEEGTVQAVFENPAHPYTRALLSAIPSLDPRRRELSEVLRGEVPSAIDPPSGCPFHPRCSVAEARCSREVPARVRLPGGQAATCHLLEGQAAQIATE